MSTLKTHLRVAIRHLKLERVQIQHAAAHAHDAGYDQRWLDAINKALQANVQATIDVNNILVHISHPKAARFAHKHGIIPPRKP